MLRLTSHLLLEALFLLASVTSAFLPTTLLSPFKILVLVLLQGIDLHAYKTEGGKTQNYPLFCTL